MLWWNQLETGNAEINELISTFANGRYDDTIWLIITAPCVSEGR